MTNLILEIIFMFFYFAAIALMAAINIGEAISQFNKKHYVMGSLNSIAATIFVAILIMVTFNLIV